MIGYAAFLYFYTLFDINPSHFLYIPTRLTDNPILRSWQSAPSYLVQLVETCKAEIQLFYNPPYRTHNQTERHRKKEDIKRAFKYIFGRSMLKGLIFGERDKTPETIAIAFIGYAYDVPFEALKSVFYDIRKKITPLTS